MALFKFTRNIIEGKPIDIFNFGKHKRDFTYIDDIVEGVMRVLDQPALPNPDWNGERSDPATSAAPYRLYNIGNHEPVELMRFIEILEACIGKSAIRNYLPMQEGDVPETYADVEDLRRAVGYAPSTSIEVGVRRFVEWYREFYGV